MTRTHSISRAHIHLEAAEWFTSMQAGNVSASERARFTEWLAESAAHVEEYLKVASVWRQLGAASVSSEEINALLAAAREDADESNVVRLHDNVLVPESPSAIAGDAASARHSLESAQSRADTSRNRPWRWAAAVLLSVAVTYSAWLAIDRHVYGIRYRTEVGQQMAVTLSDGSVVQLNTQSEVRVRMSDTERSIDLVGGEAMFEVAKDRQRPFRVRAGRSVVEAVGTIFNVYRQKDAATVTVLEGKVIVATSADSGRNAPGGSTSLTESTSEASGRAGSAAMPDDPARTVATLSTNEQARVSQEGVLLLQQVSAERVSAWTDRRLIFDGATLAEIVAEFNRYNTSRLRVNDSELADIRISAMFSATDPGSLIEYLQRAEGVSVQRLHDGTSVLYKERLH